MASWGSRARGILLFLGIAWGVALSFRLVMRAGGALLGLMIERDLLPATLVGPKQANQPAAADCSAVAAEAVRPVSPEQLRVAASGAFTLGVQLGFASCLLDNSGDDPTAAQSMLPGLAESARQLELPAPMLRKSPRLLDSSALFAEAVRDDGQCLAARLSRRHTPRHAALFRLGAIAGYYVLFRSARPAARELFLPELRFYAQEAGVPDQLWRPLLADMSQLSPDEVRGALLGPVAAIERHLGEHP
jgi:hypothetical protein